MRTYEAAALAAIAWIALHAGHMVGDHIIQTPSQSAGKAAPLRPGVHPWRGWSWCIRHVAAYTACQAVFLAVAAMVVPLTLPGVVAALCVSAGTHAVIDRRWIVAAIIKLKQSSDWQEGPYLIDQSLHLGCLFVAALAAAKVATLPGTLAVALACVCLVVVGLAVEDRKTAAASSRV
jgi:hypothetical protein